MFEEIRNLLNANSALQIQFFDARVRQQLHALLGSGGRPRLKAALNMVHTCTMHKTRQGVKNWPAYLLTLLRKFEQDTAKPQPAWNTPEKVWPEHEDPASRAADVAKDEDPPREFQAPRAAWLTRSWPIHG